MDSFNKIFKRRIDPNLFKGDITLSMFIRFLIKYNVYYPYMDGVIHGQEVKDAYHNVLIHQYSQLLVDAFSWVLSNILSDEFPSSNKLYWNEINLKWCRHLNSVILEGKRPNKKLLMNF